MTRLTDFGQDIFGFAAPFSITMFDAQKKAAKDRSGFSLSANLNLLDVSLYDTVSKQVPFYESRVEASQTN